MFEFYFVHEVCVVVAVTLSIIQQFKHNTTNTHTYLILAFFYSVWSACFVLVQILQSNLICELNQWFARYWFRLKLSALLPSKCIYRNCSVNNTHALDASLEGLTSFIIGKKQWCYCYFQLLCLELMRYLSSWLPIC